MRRRRNLIKILGNGEARESIGDQTRVGCSHAGAASQPSLDRSSIPSCSLVSKLLVLRVRQRGPAVHEMKKVGRLSLMRSGPNTRRNPTHGPDNIAKKSQPVSRHVHGWRSVSSRQTVATTRWGSCSLQPDGNASVKVIRENYLYGTEKKIALAHKALKKLKFLILHRVKNSFPNNTTFNFLYYRC